MRQTRRMLGEPRQLWIRTGAGKDPGIAFSAGAPALALERTGDDHRPAARAARVDDPVDEVDKLLGKSNGNLLAHPKMVAKLYPIGSIRAAYSSAYLPRPRGTEGPWTLRRREIPALSPR